jgi:tripeptidyl-peptidase-1
MAGLLALVISMAALGLAASTSTGLVRHESRSGVPQGWVSIGPASPSTMIQMRIALVSKDFPSLEKVLYDVSTPSSAVYGQHLTTEQVSIQLQIQTRC